MNIGITFSDHIRTEKLKKRRYTDAKPPRTMRGYLLFLALILASGILLVKVASLQVVQGQYYRNLADSNRMRTAIIHAPRGIIFDRNGKALVYNTPGFRRVVGEKIELLSQEQALPLLTKNDKSITVDSLREYALKDAAAHVVGYVGQVSEEELKAPQFQEYQGSDVLGKSGVERTYERSLKGIDGRELVEVDVTGKVIRTLGKTDPVPGKDVHLTLDATLQEAAHRAMKDIKKGAVIVSTPTGEILSLISKPSFDPNLFTLPSYKAASESGYTEVSKVLLDGENQPLLDRAIGGVYPPGSTYKLVSAMAALESGAMKRDTIVKDTGVLKVGTFSFGNWFFLQYGKTDGDVDVVKAIKRSNDIYFYKAAESTGIKNLALWSRKFGLGQKLGIDLAGEEAGTVPDEAWKKEHLNEGWYLGDNYNMGIGQGYLLTTPLQVNMFTTVFANGGTLYKPHLVTGEKKILQEKFVKKENLDAVRQGMKESCEPTGVAFPFFDFKVKNDKLPIDGKDFSTIEATGSGKMTKIIVGCKTGTAQVGGEETLPHAWITVIAPFYNPEVVVTVLAETSGEGSQVAGPIAREILQEYFEEK